MGSFYPSLDAEAAAIVRAASRAHCEIRDLEIQRAALGGPDRLVGSLACDDGWAAAALLLALAEEDAATGGARALARGLRHGAPTDPEFARAIHAFVRARVRFAAELGEVFQSGGLTLALGVGDCDDHARLVYALAVAGGLAARLGVLHHGSSVAADMRGPAHVAALLGVGGGWRWAETTVAARFGENPNDAARRLQILSARRDLAKEVVYMDPTDLSPLPPNYIARNPPDRVVLDSAALSRLGYLAPALAGLTDAADPMLREAIFAFQLAAGIASDGVLGPQTRASLASSLDAAGPGVSSGLRYPGLAGLEAPPVELSADLSDEFLAGIVNMATDFRSRGSRATAEDFARCWFVESCGLHANMPHGGCPPHGRPSGLPFGGINQMGPDERRSVGFLGTFAEWLDLGELAQLPFVAAWYAKKPVQYIHDARGVYVATFAPAFLAQSSNGDAVLYRYQQVPGMPAIDASDAEWSTFNANKNNPRGPYSLNRMFDRSRKGWITIADLSRPLDAISSVPRWLEIRARLRHLGGSPAAPVAPVASRLGGALVLLLAVGVVGAAIWTAQG